MCQATGENSKLIDMQPYSQAFPLETGRDSQGEALGMRLIEVTIYSVIAFWGQLGQAKK